MSHILALVVALGSFGLYMSAFFLPEVYRKNDFIWSGVGMFYALVLWVCAGRITGGVLLGQMASVALLGWMGWQLLESRRLLTPYDQQTRLPGSSRNLGDLLRLAADELPGRLQTQFKALPQQASGWVNRVTSRVGKSPKLANKPVRSLPKASPQIATSTPPAAADRANDAPAAEAPIAPKPQKTRPQPKATPPAAPAPAPAMPGESPTQGVEVPESPAQSVPLQPTPPEAGSAVPESPTAVPSTTPPDTLAESDAETGMTGSALAQSASGETAAAAAWAELATDTADAASPSTSQPATEDSFTLDEALVGPEPEAFLQEPDGQSTELSPPALQPDLLQPDLQEPSDIQPENLQPEHLPQSQIQNLIESADGLFEMATEPEPDSSRLDVPLKELENKPRSLDVRPLPAEPEDAAWAFDWEVPSLDSPESDLPESGLPELNWQEPDLQEDEGAIAQSWQDEFDEDFGDDLGDDLGDNSDDNFSDDNFDPEPESARETAAENAVIVSIERLNLSPVLADPIDQSPTDPPSPLHANAAEMTEDLEPTKSEPSFADAEPDDNGLMRDHST
ncbi:Ycf66 family protein [Thermoleptolyngbya sp.]